MTNRPMMAFKTHPPKLAVGGGNPETAKYGRLWETAEYRAYAPGETFAQMFLAQAAPKQGSHVIDFGCGTGRGARELYRAGMKVTMVDFVRNCLDESVFGELSENFKFIKHDLETPFKFVAEYGYCTDVLEHIPPDKLDQVIYNIIRAAKHVFFVISTADDVCGRLVGEKLHLSKHDFEWWQNKFHQFNCVIHYSTTVGSACIFYLTFWDLAQAVTDSGVPNAPVEQMREQIRFNLSQGWQEITPCERQDTEVMILGGGPSLAQFEADIWEKRANGVKLITLNGTYNWCLERGITPSATVIVDAREFNNRFVRPVVDECKYLISSQCHPSVLEGLPKDRTYLWHSMGDYTSEILKEVGGTHWPIPGGSTVLLRSIPLLLVLGYHRFHLYGCDSCIMDGKHHAFPQPENDGQRIVPILLNGVKTFYCSAWMTSQANEFVGLVERLREMFDMVVYGDGLLAHIIKAGAEKALQQEVK